MAVFEGDNRLLGCGGMVKERPDSLGAMPSVMGRCARCELLENVGLIVWDIPWFPKTFSPDLSGLMPESSHSSSHRRQFGRIERITGLRLSHIRNACVIRSNDFDLDADSGQDAMRMPSVKKKRARTSAEGTLMQFYHSVISRVYPDVCRLA